MWKAWQNSTSCHHFLEKKAFKRRDRKEEPEFAEKTESKQRSRMRCIWFSKGKKAGRSGGGFERPGWRSPPGRRVNLFYIDDGLLPVVGVDAGVLSPTVFVIRRTSTRRLSARPVEVLLVSTGLSLPRPIT